jgi:hypothetical protein
MEKRYALYKKQQEDINLTNDNENVENKLNNILLICNEYFKVCNNIEISITLLNYWNLKRRGIWENHFNLYIKVKNS